MLCVVLKYEVRNIEVIDFGIRGLFNILACLNYLTLAV